MSLGVAYVSYPVRLWASWKVPSARASVANTTKLAPLKGLNRPSKPKPGASCSVGDP